MSNSESTAPRLPSQGSSSLLDQVVNEVAIKHPSVSATRLSFGKTDWAVYSAPHNLTNPSGSPFPNPRVLLEARKSDTAVMCHLEVHFNRVKTFEVGIQDDTVTNLVGSLDSGSGYKLCPGIPSETIVKVNFDSKALCKWGPPLSRFAHTSCAMWYHSCVNGVHMCSKCTRLNYHLNDMLKKRMLVSPGRNLRRTSVGSRYPKKFLTPTSLKRREENVSKQFLHLKVKS